MIPSCLFLSVTFTLLSALTFSPYALSSRDVAHTDKGGSVLTALHSLPVGRQPGTSITACRGTYALNIELCGEGKSRGIMFLRSEGNLLPSSDD